MADIFISYSRSDRERVARLADALHSSGYSVWWDSDLAGGVEYSREIEARIHAAKAVVVVWSRTSIESTWVADEAELGRDTGKLVPLVIDDIQPKIGFRQFQSIDFCNWTGDVREPCFATLKGTLARHIEPDPSGTTSSAPRSPTAAGDRARGRHDEPVKLDLAALQSARPALTPLVGREVERQAVEACLDKARAGQGRVLFIGGEPGVGKTRLAEECLALGQKRDMLTLVGHAYEERGEPFIVAVEIIEALMRVLPDRALRQVLGDSAAEVARIVPRLRDRFPDIPSPVDLAPEQRQRYLYNAMLDFTRRLTGTVPCVILLDDLHWADESSMNLLEHIAPNIGDLPLLALLGHYRTNSGILEEGDALQREAIEIARSLDDLYLLCSEIMFSRLYFFQHTFNVRAYLDAIDETMALQRAHGSPSDVSMTVGNAVVAQVCAGQFERVRSIHAEVMPLSTAFGDVGTAAQLELFDSIVDTATGHFSRVRERQKKVANMFRESGMPSSQ